MTKVPPPVLGFNNNVRHRGRIFHIQTEDSGVRNPRIVTHLFADGGRIIKTIRTDYSHELERPDLAAVVRQLMKAQHKAMFLALRAGDLDELLEAACGPLPPTAARDEASSVAPSSSTMALRVDAEQSPSSTTLELRTESISVPPNSVPLDARAKAPAPSLPAEAPSALSFPPVSVAQVTASEQPAAAGFVASEQPEAPGNLSASRKPRVSGSPFTRERPTLSRPASRYGSAPAKSAHSIFGDGVISEKSLDEVILSYLADDLDGSSSE